MSKILDALLFAGPALAVVLGLLFAVASPGGIFARTPRRLAVGVVIPMLVAVAGALRLRQIESDTSVLLAVTGIALASCLIGFVAGFGLVLLFRAARRLLARGPGRRPYVDTSVSGLSSLMPRRSHRKGLPPGPRIRQGK